MHPDGDTVDVETHLQAARSLEGRIAIQAQHRMGMRDRVPADRIAASTFRITCA